ncbi:odorant receptor 22c [Plutella xylostella]|uniref:odorant receptor 22c n=1 Tax=Plutella xylostella TaxID=51655 RepID=UPI0020324F1C|nr:odorant receptor 22c [Plutella xylostella]
MLRNLLMKLEDPKRELLGPNVKALEFWGILLPENKPRRYMYIFLHALVFLFTFTEYVDIFFILNSDLILVLTNVKITLLATISCCKISTFLFWQKRWKDIIDYVTRADSSARAAAAAAAGRGDANIIRSYTRYSRKITYLFWSLMATTNLFVIVQPILKFFCSSEYRENVRKGEEPLAQVVSSWVPFVKTTTPGFLGASAYQIFAAIYGGGWITSYDTNAMVIMVFFRGQLELLRRNCVILYDTVSDDEVRRRIIACHTTHKELVKFAALYNSCLSPVMFLYMVICSFMLCASVYQTLMETNPLNRFLIAEFLIFGVSQLFLYCWHGNDVTFMSNQVQSGVFESGWYKRNIYRRELVLLGYQLDKTIRFTAGPFVSLNISSFTSILKGAYSYYTLLK